MSSTDSDIRRIRDPEKRDQAKAQRLKMGHKLFAIFVVTVGGVESRLCRVGHLRWTLRMPHLVHLTVGVVVFITFRIIIRATARVEHRLPLRRGLSLFVLFLFVILTVIFLFLVVSRVELRRLRLRSLRCSLRWSSALTRRFRLPGGLALRFSFSARGTALGHDRLSVFGIRGNRCRRRLALAGHRKHLRTLSLTSYTRTLLNR